MVNRYYMTYGRISTTFPNGYVILWINKNPGAYETDPHYPALSEYRILDLLFEHMLEMPNADIRIKER